MMDVFTLTDRGSFRPDNQDSCLARDVAGGKLLVVCDGMGGRAGGRVASELACAEFADFTGMALEASGGGDAAPILRDAAARANMVVFDRACVEPGLSGMGTTLVALYAADRTVTVLNVGDSRCYRIRGGALTQLTHDHSVVQEMLDEGQLTADEALRHPDRNLITRALGVERFVRSDVFESAAEVGDIFLLCTDGLSGYLPEEDILRAASEARDAAGLCRLLVEEALARRSRDNITAAVLIVNGKDGTQRE